MIIKEQTCLRRASGSGVANGFSFVELLMCLALVAVLALLLLAALSGGHNQGSRAMCMNNLRQIGAGVAIYAHDNADQIFAAKRNRFGGNNDQFTNSFVQICLEPDSAKGAASVNIPVDPTNQSPSVWSCPDLKQLPRFINIGSVNGQWNLGYQYFGGITNWCNPAFFDGVPSRSPVKFSESQPTWVIAADAVMKIGGAWGGGDSSQHNSEAYQNMPPHRAPKSTLPTGGNEVFVDGSVRWIPFEKMYYLTTWQVYWGERQAFFYQDTNDFFPALKLQLPTLAATNFK